VPRGKKQCPSCKSFLASASSSCSCGFAFPKTEKATKRDILERLLDIPANSKKMFFLREMKLLNNLCERYSQDFMAIVDFGRKFDSLTYLTSSKLKEPLDQKFRAFNFKVDLSKYQTYDVGDKVGKDVTIPPKRKTIKDFLDE